MTYHIVTGHIDRFWDDSFMELEYEPQPLLDSEIQTWRAQGYYQEFVKSFNGSMYSGKNPLPKWVNDLELSFGLKNQAYNFYKMETFQIMPPHVDHYQTYKEIFGVELKNIRRVLLMLEDWKPGHYLEINGKAYTNWKAGDWFMWESDCPHAAANIGIHDRYTLQITGESFKSKLLTEFLAKENFKLHWYNLPDLTSRYQTIQDYLYCTNNLITGLKPNDPCFIFLGNRQISDLEKIYHSPRALDIFKTNPVHIFLNEPVCSYIEGTGHNREFFSEYSYDVDPATLISEELESIKIYSKNNKFEKHQVIVHTGDYNVEHIYKKYNNYMTLIYDDFFVKSYIEFKKMGEISTSFSHKFICNTWRYSKHRHIVTAFLSGTDAKINWYYKCSTRTLKTDLYFDLNEWHDKEPEIFDQVMKGVEYLNDRTPIILDIPSRSFVPVINPNQSYYPDTLEYEQYETPVDKFENNPEIKEIYTSAFCFVICETRYAQHTGNFSEKVYQSIQFKKPFIIVAPPYTLEAIRQHGFQTFSSFWDETYDEILDHGERLMNILKLIREIDNLDHREIRTIYESMNSVLEHNLKILKQKFEIHYRRKLTIDEFYQLQLRSYVYDKPRRI